MRQNRQSERERKQEENQMDRIIPTIDMMRTGQRITQLRTAAPQAGDVGFKSRRGYCDYGITASTSDCGSEGPGSIPGCHQGGRSHSGNCSGL